MIEICLNVKHFLGISASFTGDPETEYLTQQMDPDKGLRALVTHSMVLGWLEAGLQKSVEAT
jgi:hypothetical protein